MSTTADTGSVGTDGAEDSRGGFSRDGHGRTATGRCASRSLVWVTAPRRWSRACTFTGSEAADEFVPGLMHVDLGGYHMSDIEFSAAFDVDGDKVGMDLGEAILPRPEQHLEFCDVPELGVPVAAGHDARRDRQVPVRGDQQGAGRRPTTWSGFSRTPRPTWSFATCRWVRSRRRSGMWSRCCRRAARLSTACRCSSPREPYWQRRFEQRGLPIIGDDIKSQVGATIVHRQLTRLFRDRGVRLERTHQLNVGGNTDFLNMLERERLESKKISKTQRRHQSQLDYDIGARNVHIGPSDYVHGWTTASGRTSAWRAAASATCP